MPLVKRKYSNNFIKQESTEENLIPAEVIKASWDEVLSFRSEDPDAEISGFRNPQIGAIYSTLSHWTKSETAVTVVMPTGTGKTETMLALLLLEKCKTLLVIVPTDPLREQIGNKFVGLGLLKEPMKVLADTALTPAVGFLKSKFEGVEKAREFFVKCNVVIATANILSAMPEEILDAVVDETSHLFIDEAHHSEAKTWSLLREKFRKKRVVQFTATPYRNDGRISKSEIIYDYPLRKAQEEGYFKKIQFLPVYEWNTNLADSAIAAKAIAVLRKDKETFPHILMARVDSKRRADTIATIYEQYEGIRVAKIYSGIPRKDIIKAGIVNKEFDVVVCVDMLGEGFDLPELKIAAFHDIKKSLPTTIQFVGRFTRTRYDEQLGEAKIIANLADLKVKGELDELYAQDNDWNELLPRFSEARTQKEIDFQETIDGFSNIDDFSISLFGLRPAMSTVIFRNHLRGWNVAEFERALTTQRKFEIAKVVTNDDKKILVAITAQRVAQKWTDSLDLFDVSWSFTLIHWNEDQNLLFIHSSDKSSLHDDIAEIIVGESARIVNGDDNGIIFRCLDGIHRYTIQNVGLKELIGKLRRFRMSVGTDIEPTLSRAEITQATKSHVFGVGYEFGNLTTLGCSYKGRIWAHLQNDIDTYIKWCANIGRKILDDTIDAEQVLRGAIVPKSISSRPEVFPTCIDWGSDMYKEVETRFKFKIGDEEYDFFNCDLILVEPSERGNIRFGIEHEGEIIAQFIHEIFNLAEPQEGNDFVIRQLMPADPVKLLYGNQEQPLVSYLYTHTPEIWFADGSVLEGVALSELKEDLQPFPADKINSWDWNGIRLGKESQEIDPKVTDSVQFRCIEILKGGDYDIIYDDDGSGEIADIITLKKFDDRIRVELYHLKGAVEGRISGEVANFYEVCGQTQKSVHWRFKDGHEFVSHLMRRITKRRDGKSCSRLEKGIEDELRLILQAAKSRLPFEFKIVIVQPGISGPTLSQEISTLLSITENYVKTLGIEFEVIGSP